MLCISSVFGSSRILSCFISIGYKKVSQGPNFASVSNATCSGKKKEIRKNVIYRPR